MVDGAPSSSELDYGLIAFNVRCMRMARNKTQREFAAMAGIDASTVHRVETGVKVHRNSLEKIASALNESVTFVSSVLPYGLPSSQRELFLVRSRDLAWFASGDRRKRIPPDSHERIQREEERLRLGRLGMVRSFQAYMVVMPNSPAMSQIEVFGRADVGSNPSYETCVLVCVRGAVVFRTGEETIVLEAGDSIGCGTDAEASVEPISPVGPLDYPPLLWYITANRRGQVPIEFQNRKRARARHPRV